MRIEVLSSGLGLCRTRIALLCLWMFGCMGCVGGFAVADEGGEIRDIPIWERPLFNQTPKPPVSISEGGSSVDITGGDKILPPCNVEDVRVSGVVMAKSSLVDSGDDYNFKCYEGLYVTGDGSGATSYNSKCYNGTFSDLKSCALKCNLARLNPSIYKAEKEYLLPGEKTEVWCTKGMRTSHGRQSFTAECGGYGQVLDVQKCFNQEAMCYDSGSNRYVAEDTMVRCNGKLFVCSQGMFEPSDLYKCSQSCSLASLAKRGFLLQEVLLPPGSRVAVVCPAGYMAPDGRKTGEVQCSNEGQYSHNCISDKSRVVELCDLSQLEYFSDIDFKLDPQHSTLDQGEVLRVLCKPGFFLASLGRENSVDFVCENGSLIGFMDCQPKCDFGHLVGQGYKVNPLSIISPYTEDYTFYQSEMVSVTCPSGAIKNSEQGYTFSVMCKKGGVVDFDLCYYDEVEYSRLKSEEEAQLEAIQRARQDADGAVEQF